MPVPTNTLEGAQRHIQMLPVDHATRTYLQNFLEMKNDALNAELIEDKYRDICSMAIGAIQNILKDGYDPSKIHGDY